MRILVACEFSGIVRDAFRDKGHDAWSCDLLCCERGPKHHILGDALTHLDDGWDMMLAFPPCTHLASSGAAHFAKKRKDGRQDAAKRFFMQMIDAPIESIAVENPVGIMSSEYRKPDQIIQPHHFGHAETKATCLWLKNLPLLTPTNEVEPDYMRRPNGEYYRDSKGKRYSRIHFMSGRKDDWRRKMDRSRTYPGIADAMAAQWGSNQVLASDIREITDEQSRPCGLPDELSIAWLKQQEEQCNLP